MGARIPTLLFAPILTMGNIKLAFPNPFDYPKFIKRDGIDSGSTEKYFKKLF